MKAHGRHVSLNYFILPGFTDDQEEFSAFRELISAERPDLIQLRNLNMDPEYYLRSIDFLPAGAAMEMMNWHRELKQQFPWYDSAILTLPCSRKWKPKLSVSPSHLQIKKR